MEVKVPAHASPGVPDFLDYTLQCSWHERENITSISSDAIVKIYMHEFYQIYHAWLN
jgi:hypothetical protein